MPILREANGFPYRKKDDTRRGGQARLVPPPSKNLRASLVQVQDIGNTTGSRHR